jgi:hypothetical protein
MLLYYIYLYIYIFSHLFLEYRISNVISYCTIGTISLKYAIGSAEGTISLYSNHFKSLTLIGMVDVCYFFFIFSFIHNLSGEQTFLQII